MTNPTPARPAAWRWIRRSAAVLGLSILVAGGGLRQDELDCEQTVAYLQGCCPDSHTWTLACVSDRGCGVSTDPVFSIDESQCIQAMSCDEIFHSGICDKVRNLPSPTSNTWDDTSTSHPPVCP